LLRFPQFLDLIVQHECFPQHGESYSRIESEEGIL
jgi:hypothetical protein